MFLFQLLELRAKIKKEKEEKHLHRPNQPKKQNQKKILYCSMKSAKGEPMNGNMPAVRWRK